MSGFHNLCDYITIVLNVLFIVAILLVIPHQQKKMYENVFSLKYFTKVLYLFFKTSGSF